MVLKFFCIKTFRRDFEACGMKKPVGSSADCCSGGRSRSRKQNAKKQVEKKIQKIDNIL